jgi:hypothetical protein
VHYHVLDVGLADQAPNAGVAFHFDIPAGTNFAGKTYAAAYKEFKEKELGGAIPSVIPWLGTVAAAELVDIQNGDVVEYVERVEVPEIDSEGNPLTLVQQRAIIDARWAELETRIQARITSRLRFWGYDRTIP